MEAAYDRMPGDPRVDSSRIFGFGQSLGGGAICLLARDRPLRAPILQSTFPTLDIFAAHYRAPSFLLRITLTASHRSPGSQVRCS
jgi:hypothetical protein